MGDFQNRKLWDTDRKSQFYNVHKPLQWASLWGLMRAGSKMAASLASSSQGQKHGQQLRSFTLCRSHNRSLLPDTQWDGPGGWLSKKQWDPYTASGQDDSHQPRQVLWTMMITPAPPSQKAHCNPLQCQKAMGNEAYLCLHKWGTLLGRNSVATKHITEDLLKEIYFCARTSAIEACTDDTTVVLTAHAAK